MTKHSHQRDAIYAELCSRKDHPTAEDIYLALKGELKSLSLATVYRNLEMLVNNNQAIKIPTDGVVRFDGNTMDHPHFICDNCKSVIDIEPDADIDIKSHFGGFAGSIKSQSIIFSGLCPDCNK